MWKFCDFFQHNQLRLRSNSKWCIALDASHPTSEGAQATFNADVSPALANPHSSLLMRNKFMVNKIVENTVNIVLGKKWLQRSIASFLYVSIKQRSLMSIIFRKKMSKCSSLRDYVRLTYDTFNLKPQQVIEEITQLLNMLAINKPKFILEIGTAGGGTLFLLSRVARPGASIISLDLPGGGFGGGYLSSKIPFYQTFATQNQKIYFVREDSHSPQTFQLIQETLKGHKLDLLFIDGDHTYYGVKKDFEMYSRLVKKGGLITFHDVCWTGIETGCEVYKFWLEIKKQYLHEEIIKNQKQEWAGIGLIFV
jgi:cephalosporin hydroxylase